MPSKMMIWNCFILLIVIRELECLLINQPISKKKVGGKQIKFCEYKLTKMLPKSKIMDIEACLKCSCSNKALTCKTITDIPGCKTMPGGFMTQNPFSKDWNKMVNDLIDQNYLKNYRILQVKTQVVAGTNTLIWLLAKDRLCDLTIFENLKGNRKITADSCAIGAK